MFVQKIKGRRQPNQIEIVARKLKENIGQEINKYCFYE